MTAPTVSVIMAAYNGAAWLPETLQSLAAQTFPDFEVLVVDDCSTDDTRDLVASWPDARVRLIALGANGGPVRARNRAVAEARGRGGSPRSSTIPGPRRCCSPRWRMAST